MADAARFRPRTGLAMFCFLSPLLVILPLPVLGPTRQSLWLLAVAGPLLILVGVSSGLAAILIPMAKKASHNQNLLAVGRPATGVIEDMKTTSTRVRERLEVRFSLSVHAEARGAPYPAQADRIISILEIPRYQPGAVLALKVNPDDPSDVAIEGLAS